MTVNKTAIFINPHSHTVKTKDSVLSAISTDLVSPNHRFMLEDFTALQTQITPLIQDQIKTVCIEGGDGTVQAVISACLQRQDEFNPFPKFVLLPGGMTNLAARHLGVKRPTVEKISAILQSDNPSVQSLPLLSIHTNDQTQYGFLFSTGAFAAASKYCQETVHGDGYTGAKAVLITIKRILFGPKAQKSDILQPSPLSLHVNGGDIKGIHVLTIASTMKTLMLGLTPFWTNPDQASKPNKLRLTLIKQGARGYVKNLLLLLKPSQSAKRIEKLERDGFHSFEQNSIVINYTGPMVLDGEFLSPTKSPITLSTSQPIQFVTGS